MLIPNFMGGLGNMMFQLASTYSFAKQSGHEFGINEIPLPPTQHSNTNYNDNILKPWLRFSTPRSPTKVITEHHNLSVLTPIDVFKGYANDDAIATYGYFQHASYIAPYKHEIIPLFELNKKIIPFYHDISDSFFIHIRRGDYVNHPYHSIDLTNYYKKALTRINSGIACVVSNDIPWCEDWSVLNDIRHRIVNENDLNTLTIMAHCGKGGIAANSSFSWWGLYLNTEREHLIMPNVWCVGFGSAIYVFPEATVITNDL